MAIGFLPIHILRMNWGNLLSKLALVNQYPALQRFFVYFQRTWLNANGNFLPARWNVYNRPMEFRMNNNIESYNSKWNQTVGVRHPSLWFFVVFMKCRQAQHEVQHTNMLNGALPPRRRLKWRRLEARITRLQTNYRRGGPGAPTVDQYWNDITHQTARHHSQ